MRKLTVFTLTALCSFSAFGECTSLYQQEIRDRKPREALDKSLAVSSSAAGAYSVSTGVSLAAATGGPQIISGVLLATLPTQSAINLWKKHDKFAGVLKLLNQAEMLEGELFNTFVKAFNSQFHNFEFSKKEISNLIIRENQKESFCDRKDGERKFAENLSELNEHLTRFVKVTEETRRVGNSVYKTYTYEIMDKPVR